ncbi:MAG: hypothetical protein ACXABY_17750 [Candidatus Thorarchaeota archaeon]
MRKFWVGLYFLGALLNMAVGVSDRCKDHAAVHMVVAVVMGILFVRGAFKIIRGEI